ncbi:MAG: sulfurtransferase TusA family protein [Cyanobacteria bacterium P01_H01_bin.152]
MSEASDNAAATVPDHQLDLRGTPCPINFVRTKLKLQQLPEGALLEVWIDGGEPVAQVPDSLKMEGYVIEQLVEKDRYYALRVRNTRS